MKHHLAVIAAFAIAFAMPRAALAQGAGAPSILVDVRAGTVLAGENIDRRWHPASLTKLMTALVVFRKIAAGETSPGAAVTVSRNALSQPPSKLAFPVGTVMRLENALKMMIIKSANDITVAIAESVSGSVPAFVEAMNREAFRLGLANTVFTNPTGLHDDGQFSSARDMALIALAIRREFPAYAEWFAHDAIRYGDNVLPSFNGLIGRFDGADGMKTGFVCASGYNQVGSATRGGRTLIGVVMGRATLNDRTEDLAELLAAGFADGVSSGSALVPGMPEVAPPPNLRPVSCPNGAPPVEAEGDEPQSPHLKRKARQVVNALRVRLGKPDGVEKPVPVPTPRPDYTPPAQSGALRGTIDQSRFGG
ncbi:MAG: serine hydrolase [Rhizobiaceae bacterium]|nr:serine hydrolase [Rhizobiaceae bacterium]